MKKIKFRNEELEIIKLKYANGQNCLRLVDEIGVPYMTATVAIDPKEHFSHVIDALKGRYVTIKDWSENQGIYDCLVENKIIGKTKGNIKMGFVEGKFCKLLI